MYESGNESMYNEERKTRFLEEVYGSTPRARTAQLTLERGAEIERRFEKDASEFSAAEAKEYIAALAGARDAGARTVQSCLRRYVDWCSEQGFDVSLEAGDTIVSEVDIVVKDKMYASPADLARKLDGIFDSYERASVGDIYKAYHWLLYSGITPSEVLNVTTREINFDKMVIRHKGHLHALYEQAEEAMRKACEASTLYVVCGRRKYYRTRVAGGRVLRTTSQNQTLNSFRATMTRYASKRGRSLPQCAAVRCSGMFFRVHSGMSTLEDAVAQRFKEDNAISSPNEADNIRKLQCRFRHDYNNWKKTFYPEKGGVAV